MPIHEVERELWEQVRELGRLLLEMILSLNLPVRTLEHMTRCRAETVAAFREQQPAPPAATEGEVVVLMADGKGIPMRRRPEDPRPADPKHLTKGEKKNKKRMAYVGASYTMTRFPRTVADLLEEVCEGASSAPERPQPQHKRLRAEFRKEPGAGREAVFEWLSRELPQRDPEVQQPIVFPSDGESKLEELARQYLVRKGAPAGQAPRAAWIAAGGQGQAGGRRLGVWHDVSDEQPLREARPRGHATGRCPTTTGEGIDSFAAGESDSAICATLNETTCCILPGGNHDFNSRPSDLLPRH